MARCRRDSIPHNVERELWGRSGGYCSNPACRADLIIYTPSGRAVGIGELAHVIAWSPDGPRGTERGLSQAADRVENLVLLCPTCHKVVDDAPSDFPVDRLVEWRESRASIVRRVATYPRFTSRTELGAEIRRLLAANRAIHHQYGPESPAASDPLSTASDTWRREALRVILPNNRRIIETLDAHDDLLDPDDRDALARFKVHADGFAYNQISGDKDPSVPRFPAEMARRFEA
jgi:hypothetical protein